MIGITGATGQLGQLTIKHLLTKESADSLITLVRDPGKSQAMFADVASRHFDYSKPDTLTDALTGITTLFLISGSEIGQRIEQHANVIDAAKRAGVKTLVYSSLLRADTSSLMLAEEHKATEQRIQASGMDYVILRNGWYTENYTQGLQAVLDAGVLAGAAGYGRIDSATRNDYAEAAANVLTDVSAHKGNVYELAGDASFTLQGYADAVSAVTGKPVHFESMNYEGYKQFLQDVAGLPEGFAHVLADSEHHAKDGGLSGSSDELHRLLGRATPSLIEVIKQSL